ncbi:MAG: hypothetical protein P4L51_04975 [Puia sp.]|nr:hypothetical protein [Puia sp.]
MIRDANAYILHDKDWQGFRDLIIAEKNENLQQEITIFPFVNPSDSHHSAIVSVSATADRPVESYGAIPLV